MSIAISKAPVMLTAASFQGSLKHSGYPARATAHERPFQGKADRKACSRRGGKTIAHHLSREASDQRRTAKRRSSEWRFVR